MIPKHAALIFSALTMLSTAAVPPPPGGISNPQTFAVRNGSQFRNMDLGAYDGSILVIMMMTPWCPYCQSNASAVGDGILDYFNGAGRAELRGKNNKGVEIRSLLLSTEPASQWDNTNSSFASTNGYQQWGLDANAQRQNPRVLLGYYRGGFISSTNLYDWGEDRRRVVVLNLVKGSASHDYREIVINQNAFTSADHNAARAAINAIAPVPPTLSFSQWTTSQTFAIGTGAAGDDPDGDGMANVLEFFHGTNPKLANQSGGPWIRRGSGQWQLAYRRAKNIGGYTLNHWVSNNLTDWRLVTVGPPIVGELGQQEEITVNLPAESDPSAFYRLEVGLTAGG